MFATFLFFFVLFCSVYDFIYFSNRNTRRHPEPRIPPDSRSVQILYRISGMLNESNRCTHRWWYVSEFTTLVQMWIVSAMLFLQTWLNFAQNPNSILSSPFGKMRDLQYSLNLCVFHEFVKTRKHEKWRFSHICKIVKNSKKFSYTWFISPRIIYCLVPRQPP